MRVVPMTYAEYQAADGTGRFLVRAFHRWDVWAVVLDARPALVLDEYAHRRVTVCVYDTLTERAQDIRVLKTIVDEPPASPAPSGGDGGGVPPALPAYLWLPIPPRKT